MESITLKRCIRDYPAKIVGNAETRICHFALHTANVQKNTLFFAHRLNQAILADALKKGAVAFVVEKPMNLSTPQIIVENLHGFQMHLIKAFYALEAMKIVGITGTSGKTTVSYILYQLLDKCGLKPGLLGTIACKWPGFEKKSRLTTDDVLQNHHLLSQMQQASVDVALIEATSHGLDQHRLDGVDFSIGCFTNFSHDHLDYHQTMEAYFAAKLKLFSRLKPFQTAVVNLDDEKYFEIKKNTKAKLFTYSLKKKADLWASDVEYRSGNSSFTLHYSNQKQKVDLPLMGTFNIYNVLAATLVLLQLGISFDQIPKHFASISQVEGRMQKVDVETKQVYVDFAHKPDALKKAIKTLRPHVSGKLFVVFGCGGDRDALKRESMGEIASQLADFSWITSDNPRNEEPLKICMQIANGFQCSNYQIIVDRKEAIAKALASMDSNDCVLVAGKGHETTQESCGKTIAFSDVEVVKEFSALHSY